MKRLLRSVIDCGGVSREGLNSNYQKLRASKVEWVNPSDRKLFKFVNDFVAREADLPSLTVCTDFFTKIDEIEAVERLKEIEVATPYEGANYSFVLRSLLEDQYRQSLLTALKETQEIAQKGLMVGEGKDKKKLEGVKDAVQHFQRKSADLVIGDFNVKTRANLRAEVPRAWANSQRAQANPEKAVGCLMAIPEIDSICKGGKKGELWIHAAFTGELKTVFALNWCYQLITRYAKNVFFVSLEMPMDQLLTIICVMHTTHTKWRDLGYKPLDYVKVRDGKLTPEEVAFYKLVLDDFYEHPNYGQFEVSCPDREVNMNDIKMEAEGYAREVELGFLVIDHGGIVESVNKYKDFNVGLNTVIRDAKRLALHFNQGAGMSVLLLFQINRQGKNEADKNDGRYKLSALSHANEAERSADVVTTSYLNDELKETNRAVFCNLKNRDNPIFKPFLMGIDFSTRRLTFAVDRAEGMVSGPEDALDAIESGL